MRLKVCLDKVKISFGKNIRFWLVLFLFLVFQLNFFLKNTALWWDSSVYLGMGRYIYSLGKLGLWEPIRPLILPFVLGFFWKLGLNDVFIGKVLAVFFSASTIYLTYKLGKRFNVQAAEIAVVLLAFAPIFFGFGAGIFTDIPSVFFSLLAVYYYFVKKYYFAGMFTGFAFLTKFPQALVLFLLLMVSIKNFRIVLKILAGYFIITLPYFVFNAIVYGSPFKPLILANEIVKKAGVWLFSGPWYFYLLEILKQNFIYMFAIFGIFVLFKEKRYLLPLMVLFFVLYFSFHVHKETRFLLLFLPYLALIASIGLKKLFKHKNLFWIVLGVSIIILVLNLPHTGVYSTETYHYLTFLNDKPAPSGEVLSMHPAVSLYSPKVVTPMYFMVFNNELAQKWIDYIETNKDKISFVFIDTCEGGMVCPPDDNICENSKDQLLTVLNEKFSIVYNAKRGDCQYYVFTQKI